MQTSIPLPMRLWRVWGVRRTFTHRILKESPIKIVGRMAGKLYVISTPIGNLKDVTLRAIEVLKSVDAILCEDTRHAKKFLQHYGIDKPLISYFEGNENRRAPQIIQMLKEGQDIALISDAGTPTISDPGYRVVRMAREEGIQVIPVPGPSAIIAALSVSGLPTDRFIFEGFLPKKEGRRRKRLEELADFEGSIVLYESPHRIERTLKEILEIMGDRRVFIGREMTKMHEEYLFGWLSEIMDRVKPKGEFVIVVSKEKRI